MPEWSIGTVSKTVVPLRVPRVRIPVFPQHTLKISVLSIKYPKKYPKTDFFGYFSFVLPGNRQAGSCPTASGSVLVLAALLGGVVYFNMYLTFEKGPG